MASLLGYADVADQSNRAIVIIVVCSGILVLSAGLAFVPMAIAWSRRHHQAETIVPIALLWGLATAAVSIYAYITQTNWSKERMLRIESGYFDPQDNSGAPALPWVLWLVLAIVFLMLVAWSLAKARTAQRAAGEESAGSS
jgi:hypothetical protein